MSNPGFAVGAKVRKIRGYRFPGTVVAVFETLKGKRRYVVECSVPEVDGILHIYSEGDLEHEPVQAPLQLRQ